MITDVEYNIEGALRPSICERIMKIIGSVQTRNYVNPTAIYICRKTYAVMLKELLPIRVHTPPSPNTDFIGGIIDRLYDIPIYFDERVDVMSVRIDFDNYKSITK